MKVLKIIGNILKWLFAILLVLFAVATFMGKAYVQTLLLVLLITALIWWPKFFQKNWNKSVALISRVAFILILVLLNVFAFPPESKTSIYTSEEIKSELYRIYNEQVDNWPAETKDLYIDTEYGVVHVLVCGSPDNPPLLMFHAASMGAHSWAENAGPLLTKYCIYSIDNIGEGNKSELKNAMKYPQNGQEIAALYIYLMDELGIDKAPLLGASNGGFIAQNIAYYYPSRVEKLALFCPMGITPLSGASFFMLSVASMYPFQFIRNWVGNWALGTDAYVHQKYGKWFNCIMKGTIPSVAQPVPLSTEQKQQMALPVLLFLGTRDALVGDAEIARNTASDYPNIQIEILESGHMIAIEHAETVNRELAAFLAKPVK